MGFNGDLCVNLRGVGIEGVENYIFWDNMKLKIWCKFIQSTINS